MVIRQNHVAQNSVSLPAQTARPSGSAQGSSSFASLFGSLTPSSAAESTYRPVGTIHGSVGTQTAATTTPSGPAPAAPFTAVFQQGATVTAPDGSQTSLNPTELATAPTAQEVAALLGGTVTQDTMAGGFSTSTPTLEISVPGSSVQINAGLAANLFANYGTTPGSEAWKIIDQNLGIAS
jgi:hypothetical protein